MKYFVGLRDTVPPVWLAEVIWKSISLTLINLLLYDRVSLNAQIVMFNLSFCLYVGSRQSPPIYFPDGVI